MIFDTGIKGLKLIKPRVFSDHRGYFFESYNSKWWGEEGLTWVQDNEALSHRGVLRGLHYQVGSASQAKLVRVIKGEVLDVVVDLRKDQPTYGQIFSEVLNEENKFQMLVPRGFAHGYVVLKNDTIFAYKCDNFYSPSDEGGIHPLDDNLKIDWMLPHSELILSDKDQGLPTFGKHKAAL